MFKAYEEEYLGEKAVWLRAGAYEAVMLPAIGGNLVAFRNTVEGHRYLHEPGARDWEAFKARPLEHGFPVLFPPNRYEDGKFRWNHQTYHFPVNDPDTNNHIHGFLYNIPWGLQEYGVTEEEAYVIVSVTIDGHHPVYAYFPHHFTVKLRYGLSIDGLEQRVTITNEGPDVMPCLIGFHTAVNAPFAEGGSAEDYRLKLTIGPRWELDGRMLPTGGKQEIVGNDRELRDGEFYPFEAAMDNHYMAQSQNGSNRMELTDRRTCETLVYEAGNSFKHWMIWNNRASKGFFCPEPQTSMVNAPNMDLHVEQTGLISLQSGTKWEETSRMYVVPSRN